jgi:glycoprotein-N-acetylgalactosamine 3-beta-galactosyltransferase
MHTKKTDVAVTRSIQQTWGRKCDGYLSMGSVTDANASAVSIMRDDGEPGTPWQQVQAIWQYVAKHHLADYDYFLLGDEQLFVVVENLRLYLQTDQVRTASDNGQKPLYLGRRFQLANGQVRRVPS